MLRGFEMADEIVVLERRYGEEENMETHSHERDERQDDPDDEAVERRGQVGGGGGRCRASRREGGLGHERTILPQALRVHERTRR